MADFRRPDHKYSTQAHATHFHLTVCFIQTGGSALSSAQVSIKYNITHKGHSIPNQHEIDMTSSDFFVICYT